MKLSDATILITGASQGVGRALAAHLGTRARLVIVTARSETRLDHTVEQVKQAGGSCELVVADLRSREEVERLAGVLAERGVKLDAVIHNAADVNSKPFADTSNGEIESLITTNVIGPLQLTRELLPLFRPDGLKSIVWISSLSGYKPNPSQTVYSISKAAVNASVTALRAELGAQGYHVMNVPLSSVDLGDIGGAGRVPVRRVCAAIEDGIRRRRREVFLSPVSHVLMRIYGAFPRLMGF